MTIIRDSLGWDRRLPGSTFLSWLCIRDVRDGHFLEGQDCFDGLVGLSFLLRGPLGRGVRILRGYFVGDFGRCRSGMEQGIVGQGSQADG